MTEELREKVLAVEKFRTSENLNAIEACKKMKFPIASFYTYRVGRLVWKRWLQPPRKASCKYKKRSAPQLVNVTMPTSESTVSVVVLKGSTEAIAEIVSGMGGCSVAKLKLVEMVPAWFQRPRYALVRRNCSRWFRWS